MQELTKVMLLCMVCSVMACGKEKRMCQVYSSESESECELMGSNSTPDDCDLIGKCFENCQRIPKPKPRDICSDKDKIFVVCNPKPPKNHGVKHGKIFHIVSAIYRNTLCGIERLVGIEFDNLSDSILAAEKKAYSSNVCGVKKCFDVSRTKIADLIGKIFENTVMEIQHILKNLGSGITEKVFGDLKTSLDAYLAYLLSLGKDALYCEFHPASGTIEYRKGGAVGKIMSLVEAAAIANEAAIRKMRAETLESIMGVISKQKKQINSGVIKILVECENCVLCVLAKNNKKLLGISQTIIKKQMQNLQHHILCALSHSEKEMLKVLRLYLCTGNVSNFSFNIMPKNICHVPRVPQNSMISLGIFDDECCDTKQSSCRLSCSDLSD